jgi:hypothetical protein
MGPTWVHALSVLLPLIVISATTTTRKPTDITSVFSHKIINIDSKRNTMINIDSIDDINVDVDKFRDLRNAHHNKKQKYHKERTLMVDSSFSANSYASYGRYNLYASDGRYNPYNRSTHSYNVESDHQEIAVIVENQLTSHKKNVTNVLAHAGTEQKDLMSILHDVKAAQVRALLTQTNTVNRALAELKRVAGDAHSDIIALNLKRSELNILVEQDSATIRAIKRLIQGDVAQANNYLSLHRKNAYVEIKCCNHFIVCLKYCKYQKNHNPSYYKSYKRRLDSVQHYEHSIIQLEKNHTIAATKVNALISAIIRKHATSTVAQKAFNDKHYKILDIELARTHAMASRQQDILKRHIEFDATTVHDSYNNFSSIPVGRMKFVIEHAKRMEEKLASVTQHIDEYQAELKKILMAQVVTLCTKIAEGQQKLEKVIGAHFEHCRDFRTEFIGQCRKAKSMMVSSQHDFMEEIETYLSAKKRLDEAYAKGNYVILDKVVATKYHKARRVQEFLLHVLNRYYDVLNMSIVARLNTFQSKKKMTLASGWSGFIDAIQAVRRFHSKVVSVITAPIKMISSVVKGTVAVHKKCKIIASKSAKWIGPLKAVCAAVVQVYQVLQPVLAMLG